MTQTKTDRKLDHLTTMTQAIWNDLTPADRDRLQDKSNLTKQLIGLEGHRVEVSTFEGTSGPYRFIVGKSTGWRPVHLEIKRRGSISGFNALPLYQTVRDLGKVRG